MWMWKDRASFGVVGSAPGWVSKGCTTSVPGRDVVPAVELIIHRPTENKST
jgi:hypothetical protein